MPPQLTLEQLKSLNRHPQAAVAQMDSILESLAHPEEEHRAWANDALQNIESIGPEAVPLLVGRVKQENSAIVSWSCKLLARCPNSAEVQRALCDVLTAHPDLGVQQQAALALSKTKPLETFARQSLERAAESTDPRLSRLASTALRQTDAA